jgi:RND family efflux transporter MFP subunit
MKKTIKTAVKRSISCPRTAASPYPQFLSTFTLPSEMPTSPRRAIGLLPALLPVMLAVLAWSPAHADTVGLARDCLACATPSSKGLLLAAVEASTLTPSTAAKAPALAPPAVANPPAAAAKNSPQLDCMIQPSQIVPVGTAVPGVVESVAVERGDTVTRGQVLLQLRAGVERASLAVARERATQMGETVVAKGTQELAQRELERANELYAQNFVSKTYLDKQLAEAKVAGGRSDQAGERRKLSTREVDLAQAQLAQRTVRSPISGVVVERLSSPGEFVEQKPVLRIATIDPLRVDVLVPAAAFGQVEVGRTATVAPELFNRSSHTATVKTVDRLIDAASNTFRVRLELPNPSGALPAGLRCKVDLALKLPEVERTTPAVLGAMKTSAQAAAPATATAPAPAPAPAATLPPAPKPAAKSAAASAPASASWTQRTVITLKGWLAISG